MATCLLTYPHLVQKDVLADLFCRAILLYLIINPAYANMCQNYVVRSLVSNILMEQ